MILINVGLVFIESTTQSLAQVREEWDEDSGRLAIEPQPACSNALDCRRWRTIRGDGEVIERIVSKAEQQRRQQASTHWTGGALDR